MTSATTPIVLPEGGGRRYDCGPLLTAVFKADEDETGARYSVSEWRMQPGFAGVGAHHHEGNDEIFWCLIGRPELLVGDTWHEVAPGAFLRVPAGTIHDFRNLSGAPATLLNVFIPGGFERDMPAVAAWFEGELGAPTPVQVQGWERVAAGEHTLMLAPTGSGKTLAAFLWCIDRLMREPEPTLFSKISP